jgi:hypothetical protein
MAHNEWILKTNERLFSGQFLRSKNGLFRAVLQADGNFVVYRGDGIKDPVWAIMPNGEKKELPPAGAGPFELVMHQGGDLVLYGKPGANRNVYWRLVDKYPKAYGPNRWAVLGDDGNFGVAPNGE